MKLEGRTAIVTGAGAGLGRAFAEELASHGARVLAADVNGDTAEATAADLRARHGEQAALGMVADVSRAEDVAAMVERALAEFGHLDILVNNAGITKPAMTHKLTEENWDHVVDVNQKGTFLCVRAVIPHMKQRSYGRIINLTSGAGLLGDVGQIHYSASKAAIAGMTKSWARELGRFGITVNAISPAAATEATAKVRNDPELSQQYLSLIALNRWAEPAEVAKALSFLASDEASYVTGVILRVDGGRAIGV